MKRPAYRYGVLLCIGTSIALCWCVVLPRIASWKTVRNRLELYERAGINPTAVFYTDHPKMAEIERRIDSIVNRDDSSFWGR